MNNYEELGRKIDDNGEEIKIGEGLKDDLEEKEQEQKELYNQKKQLISKFENMMGPALREGNWQPENDYSNFGDQYDEIVIPSYNINSIINPSDRLSFIWDEELFDDEEKNYYESGINQEKNYYPCIKLTNNNLIEKLKDENFRNNLTFVYKKNNNESPYLLPQGTSCKFAFLKEKNTDNNIIPVLMITNLDYGVNLQQDLNSAYIAAASVDILLGNFSSDDENIFSINAQDWITNLDSYIIVYPRLHFNFENLKIGEGELFLNIYRQKEIEGINVYTYIKKLQDFIDYYILSRDGEKYITIKPEVLIAGKVGEAKIKVNYCISNTALQIYLDAIKIMKENAYPKVSYTVSNILSQKLLHDTYNRIGQLAHINDSELKFHNVMGYISAVELDLDKPWEDNITIKNYKTKFEDLFSTIVAQTEEMKKNATKLTIAANAFAPNGMLVAPFTQESLLSSPVVLNNLIKNNADIIATKAVGEAASDKAALAMTKVYSIMNGNTGIAFTGNNIDRVALNQDDVLLIAGTVTYNINATKSVFFKLDNAHMGFFEGSVGDYSTPKLYYENGDLALAGTIYANHGWFGGEEGWIIGEGNVDVNSGNIVNKIKNSSDFPASNSASKTMTAANLGGLFYSANGKVIFTAGTENKAPMIVLNKDGFSQPTQPQNAVFLFDGSSLYIDGTITTAAGNIGGWYIGPQHIGSSVYRADCKVGMSSLHGVTEPALSFWAGGDNPRADVNDNLTLNPNKIAFCVWEDGTIKATKGTIGGWTIGSNYIGSGASRGQSRVGMSVFPTDSSYDDYAAFWAGADIAESTQFQIGNAKFQVTQTGALTATRATITGTIYATSGRIGGTYNSNTSSWSGGWVINSNTLINTNTGDQTTTTTRVTCLKTDGIYGLVLGATSTSNYGTAPFRVTHDGQLTATGVDVTGAIKATSGFIGTNAENGWTIDSNTIRHGVTNSTDNWAIALSASGFTRSINNTLRNNLQLAIGGKFGVANDGTVYASGADISGTITATAGSIGSLNINADGLVTTITVNNVSRTSVFKATGLYGLVIGSSSTSDYTNAPFRVTNTGKLTATGANITGEITATSGSFTGTITASSGKIGDWNINNSNDNGLSCTVTENNVSRTSAFKASGTYGLVIGSPSSSNYNNAPFRVTNTGKLYATGAEISGTINASGGTIGDWTIESWISGTPLVWRGTGASPTSWSGSNIMLLHPKGINGTFMEVSNKKWVFTIHNNFGIDSEGIAYAKGMQISDGSLLLKDNTKNFIGEITSSHFKLIKYISDSDETSYFKIDLNQSILDVIKTNTNGDIGNGDGIIGSSVTNSSNFNGVAISNLSFFLNSKESVSRTLPTNATVNDIYYCNFMVDKHRIFLKTMVDLGSANTTDNITKTSQLLMSGGDFEVRSNSINLIGTVLINGHRLYFHDSTFPSTFKAREEDIYLFSLSNTAPAGWTEVKVYKKVNPNA